MQKFCSGHCMKEKKAKNCFSFEPGTMVQWLNPCFAWSRIPYGWWFGFRLLHFPSSSVRVAWESSRKWLWLCTSKGDLRKVLAPGFRGTQLCCGHMVSKSAGGKSFSLCFLLSKKVCLFNKNRSIFSLIILYFNPYNVFQWLFVFIQREHISCTSHTQV